MGEELKTIMKFEEGKLILTEEQLRLVKQASIQSDPFLAGMFLESAVKQHSLVEDVEHETRQFYIEAIKAYRTKNFEVR